MHLDKGMRLFYIQATLLEDLVNCLQSLYFMISVLYMFKDLKARKMSHEGYLWQSIAVMGGLLALVYQYVEHYGYNVLFVL